MAKGGKRPGAGRKKAPHTIATETARARIIKRVEEESDKLMAEWLKIAYTAKSPALRAQVIKDIFDRGFGRPKTMLDFGDENDTGVVILPARISPDKAK